jgi:PAS domain S-box-containing protein
VTVESDSTQFVRVLRSAIAWPVGVIFFTAVLLLLLAVQMFHYVGWANHSYDVLEQSSQCENQVSNLQNQVRGFIITGDPSFIGSIDQEVPKMNQGFAHLRELVMDNPPQVIQADKMIEAKDAWLAHLQLILARQPAVMSEDAALTVQAKNLMDEVMVRFDTFNAVEEDLREQRVNDVRRMKQFVLYAGSGLFILLSVTVGQLVRRHFILLAKDHRAALQTIAIRQGELEEQKEWFRVTLSSIGDGVIVTDEAGRVVFMNGEAEGLTDCKAADSHLKPLPEVFKIINEETRLAVENPVDKVFREKKVVGLANHTILVSASGQEWPIEDSAAPIYDVAGNVRGVVLVFHNATELRQAQNTLKAHSEALEKRVAERTLHLQQMVMELEAFSYTISHDLRSPLRAMQGFAQALDEDYGAQLDDQGKNYLVRIQNAAQRLDRLIQDLLAYTRISREAAPLVPLDLDKFVRDIVEHYPNFQPPAAVIEIAGKLPRVMGREAALTQVISNLLGNATKFVFPGTTPRIRIGSEERGEKVRFWVEDNGIGIAPRDFERIFQMFTQVNAPALYGGTGVGLAIVKKAVLTMEGTVGVESEEGKGSKFWVDLTKASS